MNKHESKYFYTANLMNQALLYLLEKKDIDYITVTEITQKAGVNRSTFYLHYDNIYDLFNETLENLNKEFLNPFTQKGKLKISSSEDAFLITDEYLVPYLNFCKKHKRLLKLVHQKPHLFQNDYAYDKIYDTILYPAISQFINDSQERRYYLEFYTRGVVGIIHKWLDCDCDTEIQDLIKIIKSCVTPKK